ncbi:hypothetical protein BH11BAC1_BH11BAC1_29340 [soil metagenome]
MTIFFSANFTIIHFYSENNPKYGPDIKAGVETVSFGHCPQMLRKFFAA